MPGIRNLVVAVAAVHLVPEEEAHPALAVAGAAPLALAQVVAAGPLPLEVVLGHPPVEPRVQPTAHRQKPYDRKGSTNPGQ